MALTLKKIAKLAAGRHHDKDGLYAKIAPSGTGSWLLRYERAGREHWLGLGPLRDFDLEEARARARKARQQLRDGIDPIEAKKADRAAKVLEAAKNVTFADAARQYFDGHQAKWSSVKHRAAFLSTLESYAFPVFGALPVAMIDTPLILKVIEPIWISKNKSAAHLRGRIESVLDWSTVRGFRIGDNPARWKGHLAEVLPAKSQIARVVHHAALPYAEVPAFIAALASQQGIGPRALEFLTLTAARTGEVVHAQWSEIDFENRIWTVPEARMKGRKLHRVPLSDRAIEILRALPTEGDLVFIGSRKNAPIGKNVMPNLVEAMGRAVTIHGFRASFKSWASERTSFPREIIEAALAHQVGNSVEQAYQRSDVLEKRRKLMEAWATFCTTPQRDATVTPIRRGV
jgi:integrase